MNAATRIRASCRGWRRVGLAGVVVAMARVVVVDVVAVDVVAVDVVAVEADS
jgi:hypothetical protein